MLEQIEAFIEAKVKAEMAVVEPISEKTQQFLDWKDGKLGKNATAKQAY